MATYNGETYIQKQLQSILSQLNDLDEVIISDDSSTDKTLSLIREFNDPRIRIFPDQRFYNPIYNFEFCISQARGEFIFLSDQDDIWFSDKVAAVAAVFREKSEITLVASDAQLINAKDAVLANTYYPSSFAFKPDVLSNVIKNRFLGCTLAFRKSMLDVLLPFPRQIPMHDSWIGIMNQIYGNVYFINSPLISYRQHATNFTTPYHAGLVRMILWRWNLVKALIGRIAKCSCWKRRSAIKFERVK
jgi:glycosyltransferase involved in cell wall biosynthesis